MFIIYLLICVAAYMIGSIPFAYIFVRKKKNVDIREFGSGNVGSTNTMRAAGWRTAAVVFVCDMLKGTLPTLAARLIGGDVLAVAVALCAFFGHLYPIWLGFHGGKGVATGLGVVLAFSPRLVLMIMPVWLLTLLISGYVSLASCLSALFASLMALFTKQPWLITTLYFVCTAIIMLRHSSNFRNIAQGKESKMLRRK